MPRSIKVKLLKIRYCEALWVISTNTTVHDLILDIIDLAEPNPSGISESYKLDICNMKTYIYIYIYLYAHSEIMSNWVLFTLSPLGWEIIFMVNAVYPHACFLSIRSTSKFVIERHSFACNEDNNSPYILCCELGQTKYRLP